MTRETRRGQTPARAEKSVPAGKAEQPRGRVGNEAALTDLTDADLHVVNGGGVKIGTTGTGDGNER
jgi:hypothetical protein